MAYEPYIKIDETTYKHSDVERMTVTEITQLISKINMQLSYLSVQYDHEKKKGKKADKRKLAGLNDNKRFAQNAIYWCSAIRSAKRHEYNDNINSFFREAAADILDKQTFDKIVVRAQTLSELNAESKGILK